MNAIAAVRCLVENLLAFGAVSPLVAAGLRNRSNPDRLRLIGMSALVVMTTSFATQFGGHLNGGLQWNWSGKLACMIALALVVSVLPSGTLRKAGILRLASRGSARVVVGFCVVYALLGMSGGVPPGFSVEAETLAYQSLMPGLAEEPVYRGILPALLSTALGSPWKIAGAQLGWWWLVCSALFGMGHAIAWSSQGVPEFLPVPFMITGIVGLSFGWLAARCGSVWPCVICHGLVGATGVAIAMAAGLMAP